MILTGLINLCEDMKANDKSREQFTFSYNNVEADVFFLIDNRKTYILMFGIKHSNQYFEIHVRNDFYVKESLDNDTYKKIIKYFKIKYDPNHKFKPSDFLLYFNSKIPKNISQTKMVTPRSISKYIRNVEESEKSSFIGFLDNNKNNHRVTKENLKKTRKFMGYDAYYRCKQQNLSTRWTDDCTMDNFLIWKKLIP